MLVNGACVAIEGGHVLGGHREKLNTSQMREGGPGRPTMAAARQWSNGRIAEGGNAISYGLVGLWYQQAQRVQEGGTNWARDGV